jgi:hypothetical protein
MTLSTYAIDGFRYATTAEGDCAEDAGKSTRTGRTWCDAHSPAAYWLREDLPQAAAVRARVTKDGER